MRVRHSQYARGLRESTGTKSVAMLRNYQLPDKPSMPGERLLVYTAGVGRLTNSSVQIGESKVPGGGDQIGAEPSGTVPGWRIHAEDCRAEGRPATVASWDTRESTSVNTNRQGL